MRLGSKADARRAPRSALEPSPSPWWLLIPLVVLAIMLASIVLRSRRRPHYRVASVSRGSVSGNLELRGRLESIATVKIGSPLGGRVASISVSAGEMVKRGQTLAKLEDAELRALASGAAAQSIAAEADVRTAQVHLADLAHGDEDVDDLRAGTEEPEPDSDEAALAMAETQLVRALAMLEKQRALAAAAVVVLRRATLRSPVDGLVLERSIEVGEMVSTNAAGKPLFVIGSIPSRLRLVAPIDEVDVAEVRPRTVDFTTPAFPDKRFSGTIVALWPASAQRSPTEYQVVADVANDDLTLWPGLSALVRLPAHSAPQVLRVPIEALAFSPSGVPPLAEGRRSIWILRGGKPERVPVVVGITSEALVEIRDPPLPPGMPIITGLAH